MADEGQIPGGELRPDQLEIGKVYRIHYYENTQLEESYLARFDKISSTSLHGAYMEFTIVAYGTHQNPSLPEDPGDSTEFIPFNTNPRDRYYWRFFQTAQDRLVAPLRQQALQKVFDERIGLDKATGWGLTDGWFAPSKKSGGRKYKTRQTKLRRKNKSRKNRRRS